MRLFDTLAEAASEIRRDIAKSPVVTSSRVQQFEVEATAREALGYAYTIREFPASVSAFVAEAKQLGFWEDSNDSVVKEWLVREEAARLNWSPGGRTEELHPVLAKTFEGSEPSYTYTDRLRGSLDALTDLFIRYPDTRRGFWPIFDREDAVRAGRQTRIPCSLGYLPLIREAGGKFYLHLTYLERSCDFDRFWLSDLWLARQFQISLWGRLHRWGKLNDPDGVLASLQIGHLTHFVVSLHSFNQDEIY